MKIINLNEWNRWVDVYCNKGFYFEIIKNGNHWELTPPPQAKYKETLVFHNKEKSEKIKGKHLITFLKKGVMAYKGEIPTGLSEPMMNKKNPNALIELDYYTEVDLDRAYWTAAYRLGYITKLQWLNGMDDDYKIGGNAAVGCLKRARTKDVYVNGKLVEKGVQLPYNDVFIAARLHIINHIHDIMNHCASLAGQDKWLSIQTDAITLHPLADIKAVVKYIQSCGFSYKFETIEIISIKTREGRKRGG